MFPVEFMRAYVEAEMAMRRQLLLRGYELGRGGERLGPDEAVAFIEEHLVSAMADATESIREERGDLDRAKQRALEAMDAHFKELDARLSTQQQEAKAALERTRQEGAAEVEQLRTVAANLAQAKEAVQRNNEKIQHIEQLLPQWQTVRVGELLEKTAGRPPLFPVRIPGGRMGVGFPRREAWTPWKLLFRGRNADGLVVCWQDKTSSVLRGEEVVEFMPTMLLSDSPQTIAPSGE